MSRFALAIIAFFAVFCVVGFSSNLYWLFVLNRIAIYFILCLGLNLLIGYAGQFAFAHAALYGLSAYVTGLLQVRWGVAFIPSAAVGVIATVVVGNLVAFPALRLAGLYLALSTLSLALAAQWVFLNWTNVTFGAGGFRAPTFSGFAGMSSQQWTFVTSTLVACLLTLTMDNLLRSRFGRNLISIRENEISASCLGVNVLQTKLLAFAVSAFYAGVAGALTVPLLGFVSPENFDLNQMVIQMIMIVVGGLGTIVGSLVGVVVVSLAIEVLRDVQGVLEIVFGVLLLAVVLWQPTGIAGALEKIFKFREPFKPRRLLRFEHMPEAPLGVKSGIRAATRNEA